MRKIKLQILGSGALLATIALTVACGGQESGGVVNSTNANRSNNPNTASVVNANNSNTGIISTTNTNGGGNSNRWANANSVTREEYDKNRAQYEAEKGASTIGQGANDSWLWFKTRAALATTEDLRESTVNVDVANDVVTLRGTVETPAQKTKAEQVAKGIQGVKSVKNDLKVAAGDSVTNMGGGNTNNRNANANTNRR